MNKIDEICEKIMLLEPICYTCRQYLSFRTPDQIARHGEHCGLCMERDEIPSGCVMATNPGHVRELMIVEADSFCEKYDSIFPWGNIGHAILEELKR